MVRNISRSKAIRRSPDSTTTAGGCSRDGVSSPSAAKPPTATNTSMPLSMQAPSPSSVTPCRRVPDVAWAQVPHGRRALARLSANFYGRPAERLSITGITGTNGKTTTAFILNAMLRAAGRKSCAGGHGGISHRRRVLPCPAHHSRGAGVEPIFRARAWRQAAPKR